MSSGRLCCWLACLLWLVGGCVLESPPVGSTPRPTCAEYVGATDLPGDFCREWRALERLSLPSDTSHLRWMTGGRLHTLQLHDAIVQGPAVHLPSSLRVLDLQGSKVPLQSLPVHLEELKLGQAQVGLPLRNLPGGLRQLSVSEVTPEELAALPSRLECLRLEQNLSRREIPDLTSLRQLRDLHTLELGGRGIMSLEGIPEGVRHLRVQASQIKFVRLPPGLISLELNSPAELEEGLGQRLISRLKLTGNASIGDDLSESSPYINDLTISRAKPPLPEALVKLRITHEVSTLPPLPRTLASLDVVAKNLDRQKVADAIEGLALRHLGLSRYPEPDLPSMPRDLLSLDLSWSRVERLSAPGRLTHLDLSGVRPTEDIELAAGLRSLTWRGFDGATFPKLPSSVDHLDVSQSPSLKEFSNLPPGLKTLTMSETGVRKLNLQGLEELTSLNVSGSLTKLDWSELPGSVVSLVLEPGQVAQLDGRPPGLQSIYFKNMGDVTYDSTWCRSPIRR